jgi:hypothetical protein
MAITTVTATTIITIIKIIWSFLFLNIFPNDQSNPEPTAPGMAACQFFIPLVLTLLDLYLNNSNNDLLLLPLIYKIYLRF